MADPHDLNALWEWDSVLLLANPSPSSPFSDNEHLASPSSLPPSTSASGQRRKRDPRLICPNYLAGRVPCACPELEGDEEDNDESRKRLKGKVSKCQVPSCRTPLTGLKGYHQRHRVCLACANSSTVSLQGEDHRYCQQCGKFHLLLDFDEDKRSCRRKLERHNNRRRRLPQPQDVLGKDASTQSSDKDARSNTADGITRGGEKTQALDWSSTPSPALPSEDIQEGTTQQLDGQNLKISSDFVGIREVTPSSSVHDKAFIAPPKGAEQSLVELLTGNNVMEDHPFAEDQLDGFEMDIAYHNLPSNGLKRHITYASSCPTNRISFKFYDWNPADFPRRLRHQILEWLSNMPVELEGYIRSGCTILTLYISMPSDSWNKVSQDWEIHLKRLIDLYQCGFWDRGYISASLNHHVIYIDNGQIKKNLLKGFEPSPSLRSVHPVCLESGMLSKVTISGNAILQPTSRFLVSFDGKYLPNCTSPPNNLEDTSTTDSCITLNIRIPKKVGVAFIEMAYKHGVTNFLPVLVADKGVCSDILTLEHDLEVVKSTCCNPKAACSSCDSSCYSRQPVHDLLVDLGWALRYVEKPAQVRSSVAKFQLERLRRLFLYSVRKGWLKVSEQLLKRAITAKILENIGIEDGYSALQIAVAHGYLDLVELFLNIQHHGGEVRDYGIEKFWWNVDFEGPRGLTSMHIVALEKENDMLVDIMTRSKVAIHVWTSSKDSLGWTPESYAKALGHLSYQQIVDANRKRLSREEECNNVTDQNRLPEMSEKERGYFSYQHVVDANREKLSREEEYGNVTEIESQNTLPEMTKKERTASPGCTDIAVPLLACELPSRRHKEASRFRAFGVDAQSARRIIVTAFVILIACASICVVLQHPREILQISMSLRRCIWGVKRYP